MKFKGLKVNHTHKDKNCVLIGNSSQCGDPVDIYFYEHTIPQQLVLRCGSQRWNARTINIPDLNRIGDPEGILFSALMALHFYQTKLNQSAS